MKADEALRPDIDRTNERLTSEYEEIRSIRRQRILPLFYNRFTPIIGWIIYLLLVFSFPYIFQYFSQSSTPISLNFTLFKPSSKLSAMNSKKNVSSPSSGATGTFPSAKINDQSSATRSVVSLFEELSAIIMMPFKILRFVLLEIPRMLLNEIYELTCHRNFVPNKTERVMNVKVDL